MTSPAVTFIHATGCACGAIVKSVGAPPVAVYLGDGAEPEAVAWRERYERAARKLPETAPGVGPYLRACLAVHEGQVPALDGYLLDLWRARRSAAEADPSADATGVSREAWKQACELVPLGSCLGWLDKSHEGAGWPAVHLDYHLLALHREALRLRGTELVAWEAVQAHDKTLSARDDWDSWGHMGEHSYRPLYEGEPCVCCAYRVKLCDAHTAAGEAETASVEALAAALVAAPHGAQPDGSFLTRRRLDGGGERKAHILHAPSKEGPLAEAHDGDRFRFTATLLALRTPAEARAIRAEERADRRAEAGQYEATRRRAGAILHSGASLLYLPGQEYGVVVLPEDGRFAGSGTRVSARGALRAACLTRAGAEDLLRNEWDRLGISAESSQRYRLSILGLALERPTTPTP